MMPSDAALRLAAGYVDPYYVGPLAEEIDAALQRAWEAGQKAAPSMANGYQAIPYPGADAVLTR